MAEDELWHNRMAENLRFEATQYRISVLVHWVFLLQVCFIIIFFEDRTTEQLLRIDVKNSMLQDDEVGEMRNLNLLANLHDVFVQQWSSKMSDAIGPLFIRFINVNATRVCNLKFEFLCRLPILFDDIAVERHISRDMSELPTWRLAHCNEGVLKMSFKEDSEETLVSSARCFTCSYPSAGHVLIVPKFTHNSSLYARCFSEIVDCMDERVRDGFMHPELRFIQFSLAFRDRQTDIFYEIYLTFERIVAWNWRHTSRIELGYIRGAFHVGNFHNSADSIYITLLTLSVLVVVAITLWDLSFVFTVAGVHTSGIFWLRQVVNILLSLYTAVTLKNHFWMVFNFEETIGHIETDGRERRISPFLHLKSVNNQLLSATLALICVKFTLYRDYFFDRIFIFYNRPSLRSRTWWDAVPHWLGRRLRQQYSSMSDLAYIVAALSISVSWLCSYFYGLVLVYLVRAHFASLMFRLCDIRNRSFLDAVIYSHQLLTGNYEDITHNIHWQDPSGKCKEMEDLFKILGNAIMIFTLMIILILILDEFLWLFKVINRRNRAQR